MKILVIGGTVFLGRHFVETALEHGHEITLFNRGRHNADLFPEVEKLRGDRNEDISLLNGRTWDAVLDPSGYFPRHVRNVAELLRDSVGHYTFVSSISVYSDLSIPNMDESGPVGTIEDETVEEVTGETYGPLKVLCEQAAEAAMPGRVASIRAGLIVGPHDPSDRFTYWPGRVARGGEVLAPGTPDMLTQFVDARDLADWFLRLMENNTTGVFNATGPDYPLNMGTVLNACRDVSGSDAQITWVSEEFLQEQEVGSWIEVPLWVPTAPDTIGFNTVDCGRAIAAGLTYRPLADTIRDTLAWERTLPADRQMRAGLKPEREEQLLRLWHERQTAEVG